MSQNVFRKKTLKILLYLFYLFVILEIAARLILSNEAFVKNQDIDNDLLWKALWMKQRNTIDPELQYYVYDSLRGWKLKPGIKNLALGNNGKLNTNSKGIRANREYAYEKNTSKKRILILGDSFTMGENRDDHETFPYLLQQMLPEYEILNFGVGGYGHDQMLIYLWEEAIKYKPDLVILGLVNTDMPRNLLEFRDYAKPVFRLSENELVLKNSPVPTPESFEKKYKFSIKLFGLLEILYRKKFPQENTNEALITAAILKEMSNTVQKTGAVFLLAYIPGPVEIDNYVSREQKPESDFLLNFFKEKEINNVLLTPHFLNGLKNGVELNTHGHWNRNGNFIIAEGIKKYLEESRF